MRKYISFILIIMILFNVMVYTIENVEGFTIVTGMSLLTTLLKSMGVSLFLTTGIFATWELWTNSVSDYYQDLLITTESNAMINDTYNIADVSDTLWLGVREFAQTHYNIGIFDNVTYEMEGDTITFDSTNSEFEVWNYGVYDTEYYVCVYSSYLDSFNGYEIRDNKLYSPSNECLVDPKEFGNYYDAICWVFSYMPDIMEKCEVHVAYVGATSMQLDGVPCTATETDLTVYTNAQDIIYDIGYEGADVLDYPNYDIPFEDTRQIAIPYDPAITIDVPYTNVADDPVGWLEDIENPEVPIIDIDISGILSGIQSIISAILGLPATIINGFTGLFQNVINAINVLPQNLINLLQTLLEYVYVPSENYFVDIYSNWNYQLENKFNITNLFGFMDDIKNTSSNQFNDITLLYPLTTKESVIVSAEFINDNLNFIHSLVRAIYYPLLLFFNYKMINYLLRGSSFINSSKGDGKE